jgi:hypothetical protein
MRAIPVALGLLLYATAADAADEQVPEERIIEHELDTTQSRVLRNSDEPLGSTESQHELGTPRSRILLNSAPPLENTQVERNLGAAQQRLRSFKTREPNAPSTPLLERQLDRLSRPARVRER